MGVYCVRASPRRDPNPNRYPPAMSARSTTLAIVALGAAVALAGDACHVASGTTRYLWDGVPTIWRSAIWFPPLVAGGVLVLSDLGRRITPRMPAAIER